MLRWARGLLTLVPRTQRHPLGAVGGLAFGRHLLEDQPRTGLGQHERAVGIVAESLAEAAVAVAGGAGMHHRLDLEILLARLAPEQDRVLVARDVVKDVRVSGLE